MLNLPPPGVYELFTPLREILWDIFPLQTSASHPRTIYMGGGTYVQFI